MALTGKEEEIPTDKRRKARIVSLEGCTLMSGLINCHVHLWGVRMLDYLQRALVPDDTR